MAGAVPRLSDDPALRAARDALAARPLSALFEADPQRAQRLQCAGAGIDLHYAKQRVDDDAIAALVAFATRCGLHDRIRALCDGETVNSTEQRAAQHMALRAQPGEIWMAQGERVDEAVLSTRERFLQFAEDVRAGRILATDGGPFSDVINIGIGGSDFGPRMVCAALAPMAHGPRVHFIANVDAAEREQVLSGLDPARTLVIVTSKTFRTQETMANAQSVRHWLVANLGEAAVARHVAAVSTAIDAAEAFGIEASRVFGFWDWVGGRYSLWSAVGLPIALALGRAAFEQLLAGAHAMDDHFRCAPAAQNVPVMMGLLAVWNRNLLGAQSLVIAPYAQRLQRFIGWLQQLEMESNGKGVRMDGTPVPDATTAALWGDVGTNAQHAFFQMLHQGPDAHPVDFILPIQPDHDDHEQQRLLIANCLAQSAALMHGRSVAQVQSALEASGMTPQAAERAAVHRHLPGNRPSSTVLLERLDAWHLGALLACYEHRTFVQSVLWGINAFDQWGVELGKRLADDVDAALRGERAAGVDAETDLLIQRVLNSAA